MIKSRIFVLGALGFLTFLPASSTMAACGFSAAGDYTCGSASEPLPTGMTGGTEAGETLPIAGGGALDMGDGVVETGLTAEDIERAGVALSTALDTIRAVEGQVHVATVRVDDDDDKNIYVPRGQWYGSKVSALIPYLSVEEILAWINTHGSLTSGSGTDIRFMGQRVEDLPNPIGSTEGSGRAPISAAEAERQRQAALAAALAEIRARLESESP